MKQTAIEWLIENSHIIPKNKLYKEELIKKAKEMYEQQIMDAWNNGNDKYSGIGDAEVYYNEIFKNK